MLFVFARKNPVGRISAWNSSGSAPAKSDAVLYFAKSGPVTKFTRASVHWAERIVATRSWSAFSWRRAHRASG